ncbi:MAG: acylphosphatase [Nakamurella sp.]
MSDEVIRVTAFVHGHVQGVGFRWFTRAKALELGLIGTATNLDDGRVQVIAEGKTDRVEALLAWLRSGDAPGRVDDVVEQRAAPRHDVRGFRER